MNSQDLGPDTPHTQTRTPQPSETQYGTLHRDKSEAGSAALSHSAGAAHLRGVSAMDGGSNGSGLIGRAILPVLLGKSRAAAAVPPRRPPRPPCAGLVKAECTPERTVKLSLLCRLTRLAEESNAGRAHLCDQVERTRILELVEDMCDELGGGWPDSERPASEE